MLTYSLDVYIDTEELTVSVKIYLLQRKIIQMKCVLRALIVQSPLWMVYGKNMYRTNISIAKPL